MPQAVTHVLIALIILSLFRDFYTKKRDKRKFPLHYVLIGGIAGLLPDLDIVVFWILNFFGFRLEEVHRTFTHTLFFPAILFLLSLLTLKFKNKELGRHHLKIHTIFLMLAFGSLVHLLLDASIAGMIKPFYPILNFSFGFNIAGLLPPALQNLFFPSLDAVLLVLWLVYLEYRHRISDFV